jgi:hypothetical protein
VLRQEGRLTLNAARCWTDIAPIGRAISMFDNRDKPRDPAEVAALAQSRLTLDIRRFVDSEADSACVGGPGAAARSSSARARVGGA